MKRTWLVGVLLLLAGCQAAMYGTAAQLNKISVGMTKPEVVAALGQPNSTAAQQGGEFLVYRWMEAVLTEWPKEYFVLLVDGRVVSYGRKGDFDTARNAAPGININNNVNVSVGGKDGPTSR